MGSEVEVEIVPNFPHTQIVASEVEVPDLQHLSKSSILAAIAAPLPQLALPWPKQLSGASTTCSKPRPFLAANFPDVPKSRIPLGP